jgi:ferredoxin
VIGSGLIALAAGAAGISILAALAYAGFASVSENEPRAAAVAFTLAVILPVPYLVAGFADFEGRTLVAAILLSFTVLVAVVLAIPAGKKKITEDDTPKTRIDERDIMFSRNLLEVGTERFREYYEANPDKKQLDDEFRSLPGLLGKGATMEHPFAFPATHASFFTVEHLRSIVDGAVSPDRVECDPEEATGFVKRWALKLGALTVGVTKLEDYHKYTYVGRGPQYGQKVELSHDYAIAFTVEMAKEMVDAAPKSPIAMESAQQYLESGIIAVQIAEFIRSLGYPARAHIDGNYRVVCPLVARDAGLGEIGRMGLLMTPELGPRVRLGVVTTTLPLVTDERRRDHTMIDFCVKCMKCADVCPSKAISFDNRATIDGVRRWQINQEACFTLWARLGTDCGRCVSVCPYSHPDNPMHNLVRAGVRNSSLFRRLAIWMDDVFYGKTPPAGELPDWFKAESVKES